MFLGKQGEGLDRMAPKLARSDDAAAVIEADDDEIQARGPPWKGQAVPSNHIMRPA